MAEMTENKAFQPETRTLADRVCEQIVTAIVVGDIPPGQKISEPELARTYGISRGPLREAMRRLEALRLVERKPHIGARVVNLSAKELIEIYRVREALEGMACRLAAENMPQEEIDRLRELLDEHEKSIEQLDGRSYFQKRVIWISTTELFTAVRTLSCWSSSAVISITWYECTAISSVSPARDRSGR